MTRTSRNRPRQGYVLLVTLLMIAIVGTMTVGLARYSMRLATSSIDRQIKLQEKWGIASCQRYALQNSWRLLNKREFSDKLQKTVEVPIARSELFVTLGRKPFLVRLDDESAKLDLNLVLEATNRNKTNAAIRKFSQNLKPDLKPLASRQRRGSNERGLESWGQVFLPAANASEFARLLRDNSRELTCWGRTVNYRVASPEVRSETIKLLAGATAAAKLENVSGDEFEAALKELPARHRTEIEKVLKPTSSAHSVWVATESPHREIHSLAVRERYSQSLVRVKSFRW